VSNGGANNGGTTGITARVPIALKEQLHAAAQEDGTTVNQILTALAQFYVKHRRLPTAADASPPPPPPAEEREDILPLILEAIRQETPKIIAGVGSVIPKAQGQQPQKVSEPPPATAAIVKAVRQAVIEANAHQAVVIISGGGGLSIPAANKYVRRLYLDPDCPLREEILDDD
jgi:hypothetical protein